MAKLGDICTIQSGGTPSRSNKDYWDNGTIPWVKISDFSGKYLSQTSEKITQAGLDGSSAKIFPKGTILYTIFATLGETCILDIDATTNQAIAGLKLNDDSVLLDYLYYYLLSKKEYVNEIGRGVAQNNINMKILREMEIAIPPKEEQNKITDVLNKAYELIALRKEQLAKLDQLVKSRFIELFGDGNDERFPLKTLPQIVAKDRNALKRGPFGGALKKDDFVESGYLVYEQRHAIHNDFEYEKYYISPKKYQEMSMFKVSPGDLIISCSGVTLGRIAEIPVYAKAGIINQALLKVSLDQSIMLNTFFVHQFRSERIQDILFEFCRGSGIPNFPSMSEVKSVKFICPPIALQEQFATFVEQTDKSKLAIQQSLEKLELLKKSLMQEYFG